MECSFDLQRILTGLQQKDVATAIDKPFCNNFITCIHLIVVNVPQRRQFGARPYRTQYKTRLLRGAVLFANLFDKLCAFFREFVCTVSKIVLIQYPRHRTERIGFNQIRTSHCIALVDTADQFGCGVVEQFVTSLLVTPFMIDPRLFGHFEILDLCSHSTVDDKYTLFNEPIDRFFDRHGFPFVSYVLHTE